MKRFILVILCAIASSAFSADGTSNEESAALGIDKPKQQAFLLCLRRAIADIDDGVSPASDIAFAVRGVCAEEFKAVGGVYGGLSPMQRAQLTQEIAVTQTLTLRAAKNKIKRETAPTKPPARRHES
jgi:hypothetical protein